MSEAAAVVCDVSVGDVKLTDAQEVDALMVHFLEDELSAALNGTLKKDTCCGWFRVGLGGRGGSGRGGVPPPPPKKEKEHK